MNKPTLAILTLAVGIAAGSGAVLLWDAFLKIPVLPPDETLPAATTDPDAASRREDIRALRRRIAELEKALAAKPAERTLTVTNTIERIAAEPPPDGDRRGRPPRMFRDFKELKAKDPAKYAEIMKHLDDFRKRREERAQTQQAFFSAIDTSGMTAEQKNVHDQLQTLSARQEEILNQMQDENLSAEDRDALQKEMRETHHALEELYSSERSTLLGETAKSLGYSGDDVSAFTEEIETIIENTDSHMGGPGRGAPPPPPR